jgi:hypothetical protein
VGSKISTIFIKKEEIKKNGKIYSSRNPDFLSARLYPYAALPPNILSTALEFFLKSFLIGLHLQFASLPELPHAARPLLFLG